MVKIAQGVATVEWVDVIKPTSTPEYHAPIPKVAVTYIYKKDCHLINESSSWRLLMPLTCLNRSKVLECCRRGN